MAGSSERWCERVSCLLAALEPKKFQSHKAATGLDPSNPEPTWGVRQGVKHFPTLNLGAQLAYCINTYKFAHIHVQMRVHI